MKGIEIFVPEINGWLTEEEYEKYVDTQKEGSTAVKRPTLGQIITCACLMDEIDKHTVESCLYQNYDEAGFDSLDEFWEFLKEHWNDEIEYNLPDCVEWLLTDDMMQFTFSVGGCEMALYFWLDEIDEEIRDEYGEDFAEEMGDKYIMVFFDKMFTKYIYDSPRLIE